MITYHTLDSCRSGWYAAELSARESTWLLRDTVVCTEPGIAAKGFTASSRSLSPRALQGIPGLMTGRNRIPQRDVDQNIRRVQRSTVGSTVAVEY
ncbi:uncharacterized protein B0H18DRAFT_1034440 [Fomitopsis serialis]|uniref:uncharacterized protein n=1 Tax=Fomitopsis serialis TaxID=139415 RepID=UPI0020074CF6|nr:uncharacterized protein B0H18DRAFT_1034440 [Neoantrodia serialis]KAH9917517.1 hypothetical protein B0H18DRAFT_1034440 [Neoantrodia serialis]